MRIEIDQSGKIEQTAVNTVLAFSDGEQRTLLIPAQVKRQALAYLRGREKSRKSSLPVHADAIAFGSVGKKSEAHYLAWRVNKGEILPDHQVTFSELLEVLQQK
jgi:hypothetical protein